jgi:hypothetical protein
VGSREPYPACSNALRLQNPVEVDDLAVDKVVARITVTRVITTAPVEKVEVVTVIGIESIVAALAEQEIVIPRTKSVGAYSVWALASVDRVAHDVAAALEDRVGLDRAVAGPIATLEVYYAILCSMFL